MTEITLYGSLLAAHIAAGFASLFASFVAIASKFGLGSHRVHQRSGRVFFWGMVVVFLTAVPMSVLRPNPFLFLVALFSFYLAFAGWRLARNRSGKPQAQDWAAVATMAVTAVVMLGMSVRGLLAGGEDSSFAWVLLAFGLLGGGLARGHAQALRAELKGTERIALHISMMMGGTISTLTAFVVVNFSFLPTLVLWLGPTVLLVPVIIIAQRRLRGGTAERIAALLAGLGLAFVVLPEPGALWAEEPVTVDLKVLGAEDPERVRCAAFVSEAGFPSAEDATASVEAAKSAGAAVCTFELTPGEWAFAVYEDQDLDGALDTGAFGRPKEPYGFSAGARGRLGPPKWEDAAISVEAQAGGKQTFEVKVR